MARDGVTESNDIVGDRIIKRSNIDKGNHREGAAAIGASRSVASVDVRVVLVVDFEGDEICLIVALVEGDDVGVLGLGEEDGGRFGSWTEGRLKVFDDDRLVSSAVVDF